MTKDCYGVLKVKYNAGGLLNSTILLWRPKGQKNSMEIQEAYETLSDPEKRATYDRQFIKKPVFKKRIYDSPDRVDLTSNRFDEIDHLVDYTEDLWSDEPYRKNKTEKRN